jgi:hypothetical protein
MRALGALLLASLALLPGAGTAGPIYADATLEEYFRLEWETTTGARGPTLAGHVRNVGDLPVERMQLLVEPLDRHGTVVGSFRTWVMGLIPARQHAYFSTPVPAAAAYRVTILSFDWSNCRD